MTIIHSEEIGKSPLVDVPVAIVFKSAIFYRGKLRAGPLQTDIKIKKMDDRGITLDDNSWCPLSNVASISPLSVADEKPYHAIRDKRD
jgi:hypothetical protein